MAENGNNTTSRAPGCLGMLTRTVFRVMLAVVMGFIILAQSALLIEQVIIDADDSRLFLEQVSGSGDSALPVLDYFDRHIRDRSLFFELETFVSEEEFATLDEATQEGLNGLNPLLFENAPLSEVQATAEIVGADVYYRISDISGGMEGEAIEVSEGLFVFWTLAAGIGTWVLYIMPAYVLGLPVLTVFSLRGATGMTGGIWWLILMGLMGALVLTAGLDYIVLAQVTTDLNISGYDYLNDFGTGIFGGLVTGTALAFLGAAFSYFGGSNGS